MEQLLTRFVHNVFLCQLGTTRLLGQLQKNILDILVTKFKNLFGGAIDNPTFGYSKRRPQILKPR